MTAITPHADRPEALALCERWMARQTRPPDEWIVADGGEVPAALTMGQVHLFRSRPHGAENLAANLLRAVSAASGDAIVFIENDDWYGPCHIEAAIGSLSTGAHIVGSSAQRYYNVEHRCWRVFQNNGACLSQTAIRREVAPVLVDAIIANLCEGTYGIDAALWTLAKEAGFQEYNPPDPDHVVGIKGLPGAPGLGIGHRPEGRGFEADPELDTLREWIGDDADAYADFAR